MQTGNATQALPTKRSIDQTPNKQTLSKSSTQLPSLKQRKNHFASESRRLKLPRLVQSKESEVPMTLIQMRSINPNDYLPPKRNEEIQEYFQDEPELVDDDIARFKLLLPQNQSINQSRISKGLMYEANFDEINVELLPTIPQNKQSILILGQVTKEEQESIAQAIPPEVIEPLQPPQLSLKPTQKEIEEMTGNDGKPQPVQLQAPPESHEDNMQSYKPEMYLTNPMVSYLGLIFDEEQQKEYQ